MPEDDWTAQDDHAEVNGCALEWFFTTTGSAPAGPRPGQITLRRLDGRGWLITDYRTC